MDVSISLLSVIVLHLSILVFAFKKYYSLLKRIVPLYFFPISFCLITTITYLFKKELSSIQINIYDIIVITNIPKCLLTTSIIITFSIMFISWIIIFNFLDDITKRKEMNNST
jgi:hypothetical protein